MTSKKPTTNSSAAYDEARESGPIPLHHRSATVMSSPPPSMIEPEQPSMQEIVRAGARLRNVIDVHMDEEEVLAAYLSVFQEVFPGRRFVVRLLSSSPDVDQRLPITLSALKDAGLTNEEAEDAGLRIESRYSLAFPESTQGFDIPLMSTSGCVGTLGVEYQKEMESDDPNLISVMALHMGSLIGSARHRRESEHLRDFVRNILGHASIPIFVLSKNRSIRVASAGVSRLTGLDHSMMDGRDLLDFVPDDQRGAIQQALNQALSQAGESTINVRLPARSGGALDISLSMNSVVDADGEPDGAIAIGRDHTELNALHDQIIQSEKLATLGKLAAGVVHELNNPLTSISVYGDYLLQKADQNESDPADREKLSRIVQSAQRISRFTRDLISYARPSSESRHFLSIEDVVKQAVVFCEHVIDESGATIVQNYEEVPDVFGVRGQLHQVFINLVTNACHAMPEGAGIFEIAVRHSSVDGFVDVTLKDNGKGIPQDQLENIFEPFFSTKGEGKGTGLGLSIVRNIIRGHRGEIAVTSPMGEGTTFVVRLPCAAY